MSLILEALRKSEAERQRGRAPDLHAALSVVPSAAREPRASWPFAVALVLVGIVVTAWFWRDEIRSAAKTSPMPPAAVVLPADTRPASIAEAPVELPPATAVNAHRPALAGAAKNSSASKTPPRTATETPAAVTASARTEVATVAPEPAAATLPRHAPAAPELNGTALLRRLGDLDSATRAQLPALKVSMHVWNDDPQQRFALIDGQRLGEGAQIGDALVERIERDGVVLAWRGERLLLPRP
ncbi:MAG TPA: general secretion pathway protein GspB [Arenimonas sp.]|nr:general secretion pathway protein GspB [Arenimonas sp.]